VREALASLLAEACRPGGEVSPAGALHLARAAELLSTLDGIVDLSSALVAPLLSLMQPASAERAAAFINAVLDAPPPNDDGDGSAGGGSAYEAGNDEGGIGVEVAERTSAAAISCLYRLLLAGKGDPAAACACGALEAALAARRGTLPALLAAARTAGDGVGDLAPPVGLLAQLSLTCPTLAAELVEEMDPHMVST
jgi:hypothetical protein